MYKYLDKHSAALLVFRLSNRWFTFRMDLMAMMVTLAITTICVFTKGVVSTALAGLALSMVNGVSDEGVRYEGNVQRLGYWTRKSKERKVF